MNENTAVENIILNLLAAGETNYEFPTLQRDAVDLIAKNFTEIVYTTLKQKSVSSSTKRCNLLKLLNLTCQTPELHLSEDQYKVYLHSFKTELSADPIKSLVDLINRELNDIPLDLQNQMCQFFKRKNGKRRCVVQQQEVIRQKDQDSLPEGFGSAYSRNVSYYETSQSLIDDLLRTESLKHNTKEVLLNTNTREHRRKQVQFCYALVNLSKSYSEIKILQEVLHKIVEYPLFEKFEWQLLQDLWLIGDCQGMDLSRLITDKFPCVIEKLILEFCMEIIKLKDELEVSQYFSDLERNSKVLKLQEMSAWNMSFCYKLRNLIFELYVYSFCNENVFRFLKYIN